MKMNEPPRSFTNDLPKQAAAAGGCATGYRGEETRNTGETRAQGTKEETGSTVLRHDLTEADWAHLVRFPDRLKSSVGRRT